MDHLRVGDAERETAVGALGEHYAVGRLSKDEYDERSDAAWSARTRHDLDVLFLDLPATPPAAPDVSRSYGQGRRPAGRFGNVPTVPRRRHRGLTAVLVPALVVLGVLTVLTHLPLWLFALIGLFWLSRLVRH